MSYENKCTWKCDVCGMKKETYKDVLPCSWRKMSLLVGGTADNYAHTKHFFHTCNECGKDEKNIFKLLWKRMVGK